MKKLAIATALLFSMAVQADLIWPTTAPLVNPRLRFGSMANSWEQAGSSGHVSDNQRRNFTS